jgi:hypothetical protein
VSAPFGSLTSSAAVGFFGRVPLSLYGMSFKQKTVKSRTKLSTSREVWLKIRATLLEDFGCSFEEFLSYDQVLFR